MLTSFSPSTPRHLNVPSTDIVYFAYGSNLSTIQMRSRCPCAVAVGMGILRGWEFIINERGYANVVQERGADDGKVETGDDKDGEKKHYGVYGVLFKLGGDHGDSATARQEKRMLDGHEGVPYAYVDDVLEVEVVHPPLASAGGATTAGEQQQRQVIRALVYVDHIRTAPSSPREEYINRMNMGIRGGDGRVGAACALCSRCHEEVHSFTGRAVS